MKNTFLQGKKIYLRAIGADDLTLAYQQWFNDEEVCRYNSHHRFPMYREDMEAYFRNVIQSKQNLVLAIIDKATDAHIGNIALLDMNAINGFAELAIIIGEKKFLGKGVGTEAGKLIINHGFTALNLHRISCETSEDNIGMQKLAAVLGFTKEGARREALFKNGAYRDMIVYGLLRGSSHE